MIIVSVVICGYKLVFALWAANVVGFSAILCSFTAFHGCPVMYRLAIAILACFTARRWRIAVPLLQAGAWRPF